MNDNTDTKDKKPKKKLTLSRPGKLELQKTIGGGQVRQSFSHGRSKVVAVEVKKKRTFEASSSGRMKEVVDRSGEKELESDIKPVEEAESQENQSVKPTSQQNLTEKERTARALALQVAQETEQARKDSPVPEPIKDLEPEKIQEDQIKLDEAEIEAEKIRQSALDLEAAEAAAAKSNLDKLILNLNNKLILNWASQFKISK